MTACQSGVPAEDPEQFAAFDGNGVELGPVLAVLVAVVVGSTVQTDAAVVLGAELIDQTATPTPITATRTTATIARTPYTAGTRSGCRLSGVTALPGAKPGGCP
jgi:hypothetical protein